MRRAKGKRGTGRRRSGGGRAGKGKGEAGRPRRVLMARDLMTRDPVLVDANMLVGELCDLLQVNNINGAPVVDPEGRLLGVVTQDDIIYGAMGQVDREPPSREAGRKAAARLPRRRRLMAMLRERQLTGLPTAGPRAGEKPFWSDPRRPDPLRAPVSAIMTSPAIAAEETTPITALCRIMWNLKIHRVPILRRGRVTGLVSSLDLCRAILAGQIKI